MTQYSRYGGSSTPASMIAVGNVQAVGPSNMMTIQNHQRIHRQDHLAGSLLLSFPLSTIISLCRWVNGKLIRHWL